MNKMAFGPGLNKIQYVKLWDDEYISNSVVNNARVDIIDGVSIQGDELVCSPMLRDFTRIINASNNK